MTIHFGVNLKGSSESLKLARETYIPVSRKTSKGLELAIDDEKYIRHVAQCMLNYDKNMERFAAIRQEDFENELISFLARNLEFSQVYSLADFDYVSGYYIMVLDQYKQVYIGTTNNIKKRIMQHWSKKHPIDRLIYGNSDTSVLSINSFKALDTTRIFVAPSTSLFEEEDHYIQQFNRRMLLNRITGGEKLGFLDAILSPLDR